VFGAAFLAAVIADIVSRILAGAFPVFTIPAYPTPPTASLVVFAVLGIIAGFLGVAFNRALLAACRRIRFRASA
jgi:CIC family chloride channel protein